MTSIDTPEVQDPQNPQGQPMPGPPPGTSLSQPPPVLPRPVDEHDLEQSVKLIRQALHHKSQEIDLLYLQHMAAQGQLGQYQAEQMQQATGNNMQVEAELMSQGLPLTDVRSPQSRQAYEDWHADFSARAIPATPEMAPQVDAIQKRYQDFHDTAKKYDQDKEALRSFLSPTVRTYEHGFQNFADVANKAASGLTGGYFGTTDSRVEQIASELKDKVEELTNARYPNLPWNTPEDKGRRESYQRLLSEEAFAQLKKVADRPGLHPGKATEFAGKAAELLGMAIPMGAAAKAGQAVTGMAGAAKTVVGKMAQHVGGDILGFAAYGAAIKPNKDQQQRIESLPPGDKGPGELAARVENAIDFGLFAPLYSVAGAIGRGAGSMGKAGSMVGHTAAGVGIGAMMPVAGELADQLKAAAIDSSPALQDLVQRRLIARPSLQGPVRGMDASFAAGDWPSFWANAKDYIKEAAPGMAAFGLLGFASGLASARPKRSTWDDRSMDYKEPDGPTGPSSPKPAQEAPKLPPPEVEKAAEQAHKEVDKFAGGDENLAEALHDVVDRKAIELIDESQPPKTQVDELGAMVGPAEARRQSTELVDVKDTTPWSERPKATTPGGGNPQRIADLRQEAALLERKLKRAKPGKQAAIESRLFDIKHEIRDEYVKEGLRPAADYAVKPADYASEIRSRGEKRLEAKARVEADPTDTHAAYNQELWRGAQQALRYKRVAANATSPQVRQAAQQRASAWTLYGRQLEAWNAGKQRGESPTPPYFERMTPEGKAEAQDFHATEAFNASMEKVPPQQRAAGEVASYRESPQRIVDEANASGDRAPGMVVQTEDGRKVTVASHEQGETRAVNEDGDLEQVEGGKVLSLGQAPTVAPDAVRDAQGQVDAAHVAGQAAPPEAARTVIAAQEAAQAKASDPATNVSQDPFEAKVIRQEAEKSGTSTAAERIVRQAELATPKPWRGTPVHSGEIVRVADIGANPERFQFRLDYGEGGQTSDRPVIEKWNPDLGKGVWVWQDKDGKMWVADGHHRLARAKKLGVEDLSVELYREADGVSAEQIRALAALKNISQPGGAKAIDVMEFVALHPQKAKALEDAGVPMTLASVAKGIRLANLPQVARREVIKGDLPEGKAAIVGDAFGKNQDIGFEMLKGLRNNKRWQRMTEPQFEVLARMLTEIASKAGPAKKAQAGLFGAIPADYALEDKAELVGSLTSAMRKEVSVLRLASKPRHQDSLKSYGNIIKAQSNLEAAGRLEELADIIDREVTLVGPVSSAVVEALKAKMPLEQARQHVLAAASKLAPSLPSGVKPPSPPEALPEIPVPKAGDVPPRPPTPETTPHTEFPKETADLAKLESLAASVAGAARGPYGMLCELKEGRSKRSLQDAVNYLDAYLAREGIPEEHRQFAEWAKEHAETYAGKTGERFGAELLNGYLEAAVGREHMPFTETLQDLTRGLDAIEALPKAEQQRQFVGWAAAEAESLTGPWSVAARYTWAGKKILDRVQRLGDPLNSQRGSVINPLEWPVQGVAAIGKALWNWRGGVRRRLMEQMSREPKTTAGLTRKVFGGYFETFGNWGGRICREAIAADTKSHAELERVKVDMFHATSGLLSPRRWQEGTAKSKALFQVLDQGLRGKVAKSLLPKAKAGDLEATDILKTAIALKRWMRGTWKIATDVHPTTLRLREHLHYLAKDIASLEGERAPKQAELDASKAFGATHAELADVNKRLLAAKKDARKWFGGLKGTAKNHKAPKGTPPKALDELRREAREMGSRRAAIYRESGIKLPEVLRGVVGGLTRRIRAMKGQQRALAGELERFRKSYGIKNYVKHASILEILPGGVARDFTVDKNGVSSMEARRRIYSDSTMHRDEWLRTKGLLHEDGVRAMWHYIHSIVPYIHRSRFLSKIDRELYGDLTLLPFREVAMGGGAEVHFGDLRGLNLGLHDLTSEPYTTKRGEVVELPKFERTPRLSKEERAKKAKEADERRVAKAAGLEVPEVPDKGHVLLWVGDPKDRPSKAQLGDVRWVSRHMQSERNPAGGLLAIPKGQAILRAFKGGWWERADAIRQGDMVKAINLTVGALSDQQRGMMDTEFGRILKPLNRIANTTAGIVSANVLGGFTNAHNALNNLFAATIQNAFFFGGRTQHAPTSFAQFVPRYIAHVAATIMRSSKTTTPKVRREKGREALSVSWDEAFRTPKEKLDKLSPEKRAAQQLIDDCHVAFMQSGAAGANHANYNFGQPMADVRFGRIEHPGALRGKWESARAKLKWVEGELEKVEPGIAAKIGQTLNNLAAQTRMPVHAVKRMWYALFSASEIGTRFPPFAKGYLEGRERGLSHDQALAEGLASLHLTQVVFSKVGASDYLRSPFGKVFGNLQRWTTQFSGRVLALPKRDIAAFAAFSAAIIALAQTYFGLDWWDMLGTRVSNVPLVGPKANSMALGIGTRTEADPSGATPKGPIYDAGIRSLAVPLPLPVGVGPSAKVITDLIGAAVEWYQGNGEAAAKHLNAARAGFDPTRSNWVRQMEKAFGESNVPQSDGTALYVNKDTGKGSTILTQRGWLEYAKLMLPGTDLAVAQQWQENELSHAASEQARKSNQEFSALGKDWTHALIESQSGDPAAKALEQELRAELVHQAKQLGKKVSYATWHDTWLKDAEWERNSDMRLRTAVSAPDKISKVRELTRLVEDPNYPLSRERFLRAATFLGGKKGFADWLADVPMAEKVKLDQAVKRRMVAWER